MGDGEGAEKTLYQVAAHSLRELYVLLSVSSSSYGTSCIAGAAMPEQPQTQRRSSCPVLTRRALVTAFPALLLPRLLCDCIFRELEITRPQGARDLRKVMRPRVPDAEDFLGVSARAGFPRSAIAKRLRRAWSRVWSCAPVFDRPRTGR